MYVQVDSNEHVHSLISFTHHYPNRGSQEERITILNMALTEKGIVYGTHYDPNYDPTQTAVSQPLITQPNPAFTDTALSDIEEDGVYL